MPKLTIRDLIDIINSDAPEPEKRMEKVFEWEHARRLEIAKWTLTASAATFVPVAVSYLKDEVPDTLQTALVVILFLSVFLGVAGGIYLYQVRSLQQSYVAGTKVIAELKAIGPLVRRYRGRLK